MPSAALKVDRPSEIDPTELFERLRKSGLAAVQVAGWLPAFLRQRASDEDKQRVRRSIESCRIECEVMVAQAEACGESRLAETARKALGLWAILGEKTSPLGLLTVR